MATRNRQQPEPALARQLHQPLATGMTVVDQRRVEGCTAQYCTTGTIRGNHGLRGTFDAEFDSFAAGPATTSEPARTISFSSVSTITTERGTIVTRETGISAVGALEARRRFSQASASSSGAPATTPAPPAG